MADMNGTDNPEADLGVETKTTDLFAEAERLGDEIARLDAAEAAKPAARLAETLGQLLDGEEI